jgi:hypothetical protein
MVEAVRTSETSINFNVTTRRYVPEHSKLYECVFTTLDFPDILDGQYTSLIVHGSEALGRIKHFIHNLKSNFFSWIPFIESKLETIDGWIGYDGVRLTSQNCGLYGPTVHSRLIAMWIIVWRYRLRLIPNSSTRVLWHHQYCLAKPETILLTMRILPLPVFPTVEHWNTQRACELCNRIWIEGDSECEDWPYSQIREYSHTPLQRQKLHTWSEWVTGQRVRLADGHVSSGAWHCYLPFFAVFTRKEEKKKYSLASHTHCQLTDV